MLEEFAKKYHQWRRRTLPSAVADIEWRRAQIERTITKRFLPAASSPVRQRAIIDVFRLVEPKAFADFR
ncbi:MAG: hypothetical protein C3F11_13265 [Methylocystaceae bacterium]|nr:MAG: hypothetical protein C3F11_13265 [Methylocystaceae bacterium]